jgi:hypothetical protein
MIVETILGKDGGRKRKYYRVLFIVIVVVKILGSH